MMRSHLVILATLLSSAGAAQTIIADSFADFSGVQGQNGWTYRYYDKTHDATPLSYDYLTEASLMAQYIADHNKWYVHEGEFWTMLGASSAHGNGIVTSGGRTPDEQIAIRRWTSNYSGKAIIAGEVAKISTGGGNGVMAYLKINGVTEYAHWIDANDSTGVAFSVTKTITAGDAVEWWLDPFQSNDLVDLTSYTATVTAVPEPSVLAALACGAMVMLRRRPRK